MAPELIYTSKTGEIRRITCQGVMTIGRDATNTIIIEDPMISRNHAIVKDLGNNKYYVLDAGSRNGVYLNGRRLHAPVQLKNGDEIVLGDSRLCFVTKEPDVEDMVEQNSSSHPGCRINYFDTMKVHRTDIRQLILLVGDIRSFTTLSSQIPLEVLTKVMSHWFHEVELAVAAQHGQLIKFTGDGFLAQWQLDEGATGTAAEACQVLKAALEITRFTEELERRFPELGRGLRIGMGINLGAAAVGVGDDGDLLGDMVNTTFRLESASKELQTDLVCSQSFRDLLPEAAELMPLLPIQIKGKESAILVSAISYQTLLDVLRQYSKSGRQA